PQGYERVLKPHAQWRVACVPALYEALFHDGAVGRLTAMARRARQMGHLQRGAEDGGAAAHPFRGRRGDSHYGLYGPAAAIERHRLVSSPGPPRAIDSGDTRMRPAGPL